MISGLDNVEVKVTRVVYSAELPTGQTKSEELTYILFGKENEFYLAHRISQAPDYDQIVGVKIAGHNFCEAELDAGVTVKDLG